MRLPRIKVKSHRSVVPKEDDLGMRMNGGERLRKEI